MIDRARDNFSAELIRMVEVNEHGFATLSSTSLRSMTGGFSSRRASADDAYHASGVAPNSVSASCSPLTTGFVYNKGCQKNSARKP